MTTPGNNGANTPEDDDPFGYLYEDGQAAGANPPRTGGGYGYPGPTVGSSSPESPGRRTTRCARSVSASTAQIPQQQYGQQQAQQQARAAAVRAADRPVRGARDLPRRRPAPAGPAPARQTAAVAAAPTPRGC